MYKHAALAPLEKFYYTIWILFFVAECQELQAKLNNPTPTVKVASLGATKKPKSKRGKSSEDDDSVQNQMALLTTQRDALEEENVNLKSSIHRLEEMIDEKDLDRRTLQQRVELLMSELSVASAGIFAYEPKGLSLN